MLAKQRHFQGRNLVCRAMCVYQMVIGAEWQEIHRVIV